MSLGIGIVMFKIATCFLMLFIGLTLFGAFEWPENPPELYVNFVKLSLIASVTFGIIGVIYV